MKSNFSVIDSPVRHVHFIGIGGIGISALARMLLLEGASVSGSDRATSRVTEELLSLGAHISIGHAKENLPAELDEVIYTIAIPDDNPELVSARERGVVLRSYPEALGELTKEKYTIAVSGTHGKTTTTAMLANILIGASQDPTVVVGSLMSGSGSNFIGGKGRYLVCEACEYRRSFLNLSPSVAIITNIDADHLDYYKDIDDIAQAFRAFAEKVPSEGAIIADLRDSRVAQVLSGLSCRIIDYSLIHLCAKLSVPGEHNRQNAQAAKAVAEFLNIPDPVSEQALAEFKGTWRRFEFKGVTAQGALLFDDYAHHPSEIRATLSAAREKFPSQNILVAFQPHLYSRTRELCDDFAQAFCTADAVFLAPIYAAREPFDARISSETLAERMRTLSPRMVSVYTDLTALSSALSSYAKEGDIIITMGAGDIYTIAGHLLAGTSPV